jgi:hypothetical protein
VAILGPTPDSWRKYGLDRNPFNTDPWYLHSIWQAFGSLGLAADYINGSIIKKATFKEGRLIYNKMSYQAVVVCDVESLDMPVARSILQYVESGGKVIFLGEVPSLCPGMRNHSEYNEMVRSSIERAIESGAQFEKSPDESLKGKMDQLVRWAGNLIENYQLKPGISITNPDARLLSAQYCYKRKPILFLCNTHQSKFIRIDLVHSMKNSGYWRWDPENGSREKIKKNEDGSITLDFKPLESVLIILDPRDQDAPESEIQISKREWTIEGHWELECKPGIEGDSVKRTLNDLVDLTSLPDLKYFSGTAIYRISFSPEDTDFHSLELGSVHDLAEVKLNGKKLGIDWYGNKTFPVKGDLVRGKNELEIRVVNTLLNYCISRRENPEIEYWLDRYRNEVEIAPVGLMGPVKLIG